MKRLIMMVVGAAMCVAALAQGTPDDYRRAMGMRAKYADKVYCSNIAPQWVGDTHSLWYARTTPDGREYVLVNADTRKRSQLLDPKALSSALAKSTGKDVAPDKLALQRMRVSETLDTVRFAYDGHRWAFATKKGTLIDEGSLPTPGKPRHWMEVDDEKDWGPVTSPDGLWTAYIKNDNVHVRSTADGTERQLSIDGTLGNYYSSYLQWSPDSKKLAACKIRPAEKRYVYYVESAPTTQLQPVLHKQEYAKPGDELRHKVPCIFDVTTGEALIPDQSLFSHQYDLYGPQWDADSRAITFEYNERGHKHYRVLEMSAADGTVRPLIEEEHDKYVNYPRIYRHHLADGKHIIWSSERDNYNHLYMYDRDTAAPTHQITKGEWYVRDVIDVDEDHGVIYFMASGVDPYIDPYLRKLYRVNLDGSGLTCLTPDEGDHQVKLSADRRYVTDVYSTVTNPPVAALRDASTGQLISTLEVADISRLTAEGWTAPEVFVANGRDGSTPMWGLIFRPSNFDPSKTYPIVEYIYQGPGDQYVPKTFTPYNHYLMPITELGFIVVMVDGMGTSFRSREFENVCYKNLKDAALPDHIAWIEAAAEKYPYMDIDRVGIFGASAGGQESTTAVLTHPEFYKAAYSSCGCHDNRMDKIWWNELWMGYPVDESYAASSNVEMAPQLTRPLMLVVGELDDNVDPASTMQVAAALIKANKDFELVVIPGAAHTMGEGYGDHKRYDFFTRHLHGINPPDWADIEP